MSAKNNWRPSKGDCSPRGLNNGYVAHRQKEALESQPLKIERLAEQYKDKGDQQFFVFLMKAARKFRVEHEMAV